MKKIFLIFSLFILIVSLAKADDTYDCFKLKEIKTLGDINNIQCDLCAGYLGIEPKYGSNSVGIRYSYIKYSGLVTESTPENPDGITHTQTEIFSRVELIAKYNVNNKFRLTLTLPFKLTEVNDTRLHDFADISVVGQLLLYSTPVRMQKASQYLQRIYAGVGIKAPTGIINKTIGGEIAEAHFQPGTGSFDFLANATYFAKYGDIGFNTDIAYSMATKNKNNYQYANRFNFTAGLFYQINSDAAGFLPHAGVYYESAGFDTQDGINVEDSGGNVLFLTGGLDVYFSKFSVNFNYQHPVNEKLNGPQPPNKFRLITGLSYYFGK